MRSHLTDLVGENTLEVAHCSSHQLALRKQKLVKPKKQWQAGLHQGVGGSASSSQFSCKRMWVFYQLDQKTVTSDLDQPQSTKSSEMDNNGDPW